jgi:hypothetical protein
MQRGLTLSLAAVAIFGAGWWAADLRPATSPEKTAAEREITAATRHTVSSEPVARSSRVESKNASAQGTSEVWQLVRNSEAPARTPVLLRSLEQWTGTELQPEQVAVFDKIMEQGDYEECSYVLSLFEQREEVTSVAFLVKQLDHPEQDIRERALMACESVAGTVFSTADDAKLWAKNWQPDPAVAELFRRSQQADERAGNESIGPRKHVSGKKDE